MKGKGIVVAGNLLTDKIKIIDSYPEKGMLVNIASTDQAVGGCVPNTIIDLAVIDPSMPLKALGKLGRDSEGEYILQRMQAVGVDTSSICFSETQPTSFTDVMTVQATGERTFFHAKGANSEFDASDINVDTLDCDIFHIGYLLLLDRLDRENAEFGTEMAKLLAAVQSKGIKTSVDVVSEAGDRFAKVVPPALRYCNYAILNEIEAGSAAKISPRHQDGTLDRENVKKILRWFLDAGVKDCAVIHCPEMGFAMTSDGTYCEVPSLDLPKGYIKGSVGAGDAFCAGMLYSLYRGDSVKAGLEFASCAAACNLSQPDSVSGMRSYKETLDLQNIYRRKSL